MELKVACLDARIIGNRKAYHRKALGLVGEVIALFMRIKRGYQKPHFVGKAAVAHRARQCHMPRMNRVETAAKYCCAYFIHQEIYLQLSTIPPVLSRDCRSQ